MQRPFPAVVPSAMVHASEAAGGEGLECQPTCGGTFHSSSLALEMKVTEECSEEITFQLGKFPLLKCDDLSTG